MMKKNIKIIKRTEELKKLWIKGKSMKEIANILKIKLSTVGYYLSINNMFKKYPHENMGRFSTTHQYSNRNKFTSKQIKKIVTNMWKEVREGKRIIRRKRNEGVINPAWDIPGEQRWNWKGGRSNLTKRIRDLPESKEWTKKVFKRDDYTCQDCEKKGGNLEAHHKKSFVIILQDFLQEYNQFSPIEDKETLVRLAITYKPFWDILNGKTLCKDCHKKYKIKIHSGLRSIK